jgi:hypothetical protein
MIGRISYKAMVVSVALMCLLFVMSCATTNGQQMTPKRTAAAMMGTYNAQNREYRAMAANPDLLTEEQKKVMRIKKPILQEAKSKIKLYVEYAECDDERRKLPPEEAAKKTCIPIEGIEAEIDALLWKLETLALTAN